MPGPVPAGMEPVEPQSLKKPNFNSLKRVLSGSRPVSPPDPESRRVRMNYKLNTEYASVKFQSKNQSEEQGHGAQGPSGQPFASSQLALAGPHNSHIGGGDKCTANTTSIQPKGLDDSIIPSKSSANPVVPVGSERPQSTSALMERVSSRWPRPEWHAPWKCYRVLEGHMGWVKSVAVDPSNSWFCTGSADRTIKIWDLASGRLKLTLTGHIEQIRGLAVSTRHTYMFSAGDDKQVKCWDLEQNKVIRSYHGHLSGVYCLAMHPTLDLLLTGGRDSVCRVWDIRTKVMAFALSGHTDTVCSVFSRPTDPQVVTGSHDTTIKFWDLAAGKTMTTLTNHKKSVRALAPHPNEHCFASASADNVKKFKLPKGEFLHNMLSQQKSIINAASVNENGVLVTAGHNGRLWFWDWISGYNFHQAESLVQPGSLDCEAGIYALTYDMSGTRLITCEADKTVKMWKEDPDATPETHPIHFKPPKDLKRY